jgi:2-polyprenyl-3-methyl-5-hydroxy-6-metoxy-1,4-benzoquinol methylase
MHPTAPLNAKLFCSASNAVLFHENLAGKWEQKYLKSSFASRYEILSECLTDVPLNGTSWLDAGCGTGTLARRLAEQGCEVHAVDAAPEMLRVARELTSRVPVALRINFQQLATIEELPFPADCFDGVLCSSVLEYVADPDICVEELRRVLRPNGILLISVPSARSIVRVLWRMTYACTAKVGRSWPNYLSVSKHQYSVGEFRALLLAHGLVTEKCLCFGMPIAPCFATNQVLGSLLMFRARKKSNRINDRGLRRKK